MTSPLPPSPAVSPSRLTRWGHRLSVAVARVLSPESARHFAVRHYEVPLPDLPDALVGTTLAQLSDIHVYEYSHGPYQDEVIAAVNALQPDWVVATGDIIHYGQAYLPRAQAMLGALVARQGKLACMGNHDYDDDANGKAIIDMMQRAGFDMLVNRAVRTGPPGGQLWMSGVDDIRNGSPDIAAAFADIEPGVPHIALAHNPELAPALSRAPQAPDLILSGHTHGGQINHPVFNFLAKRLFKHTYPYGWFTVGKSRLYVTSGVGSALVAVNRPTFSFAMHPFRVNTVPEVAVFKFIKTAFPIEREQASF